VALSAPYRLKCPDRRFEEFKNYSSELQTNINNIIKIRTVSIPITSLALLVNCLIIMLEIAETALTIFHKEM